MSRVVEGTCTTAFLPLEHRFALQVERRILSQIKPSQAGDNHRLTQEEREREKLQRINAVDVVWAAAQDEDASQAKNYVVPESRLFGMRTLQQISKNAPRSAGVLRYERFSAADVVVQRQKAAQRRRLNEQRHDRTRKTEAAWARVEAKESLEEEKRRETRRKIAERMDRLRAADLEKEARLRKSQYLEKKARNEMHRFAAKVPNVVYTGSYGELMDDLAAYVRRSSSEPHLLQRSS
mmetsp:Transcript_44040/g.70388  ORF Transcript_44040/g.70388 Transcript_44040/m.70388 type:complete len:237 (-) Transcript_44040:24-734(-)